MPRSDSAIVLFTLTPEAEGVRKPLGLHGPERAAALFATLVDHVATVCARLTGADLVVASESPLDLAAGTQTIRQRGSDFGESLRLAVEDAFALGYRRVVVIGNDAPEISEAYLQSALDALTRGECEAVVGPATDGGYNLLGLTGPCDEVFDAMPWSSADVLRLTVERLRARGFGVTLLAALADIDSARELARFLDRVERRGRRAPLSLARLVSRIRRLTTREVAVEADCPHRELISSAGVHGLRAPPVASITTL